MKNHIDKHVHSKHLGISYDVTIRKYKQLDKTMQNHLRGEGQYFKLYKNLTFDVVRSRKQLKRRNKVTARNYASEVRNKYFGGPGYTPQLTNTNPSTLMVKTIHHLS